eukprot:15187189-Alexandrium_andersonii.AAC.1
MSASLVGSEMCIRDSPVPPLGARSLDPELKPSRALKALQEGVSRSAGLEVQDCVWTWGVV